MTAIATDAAIESQLAQISDAGERLRLLLDVMKKCGMETFPPDWKGFWHWRGKALEILKEPLPAAARSQAWAELSQVTREVRQLQAQHEEAGVFVAQQLALALDALSIQMEQPLELVGGEWAHIEPLAQRAADYTEWAARGQAVHLQMQRLAETRAELARSAMPQRERAHLWQRIELIEAELTQRRKTLCETASPVFVEHIGQWEQMHFGEGHGRTPAYQLLDQIKHLQMLAKAMPLERGVFMQLRGQLSRCWEVAKEWERVHRQTMRERRKEKAAAPKGEEGQAERPKRERRPRDESKPRRERKPRGEKGERRAREEGGEARPREARPRKNEQRERVEQLVAEAPTTTQIDELKQLMGQMPIGFERERLQLQIQAMSDQLEEGLTNQERIKRARQRIDAYKRLASRSGATMDQALATQEAMAQEQRLIGELDGRA